MELKTMSIINLILTGLVFVYMIFLLKYLGDAKKCDKIMKKSDVDFRKAAYVITWIGVVIYGLAVLGTLLVTFNVPSGIKIENLSGEFRRVYM